MKNLFNDFAYAEIQERLNKITPETKPNWGKMDVGQMLHHCQKPLEIALQQKNHKLKSNLLAKWFFKKSLYNDKPWVKNLPTPKAFKVVDPKEFITEKSVLEGLMKEFNAQKDKKDWPPHPVFGSFTTDQWGMMQYKHLDHHFRQFGV